MQKSQWKKFLPVVIALAIGAIAGFAGKATADGSLPTYVGCKT